MKPLLEVIDLKFASLEIYSGYVINQCREGALIDTEQLNTILMVIDQYYPNQEIGYISNRLNSYTVNPIVHKLTDMHKNIALQAVVCYSEVSISTATLEQKFFKKPFKIFTELDAAKIWADVIIEKRKKAGL